MQQSADSNGLWHWSHGAVSAVFSSATGGWGTSRGLHATDNVGLRGDDDPAAVIENRRRLVALLAPGGDLHVSQPRQVHGAAVAHATGDAAQLVDWTTGEPSTVEADALLVSEPGVAAAITVADCMPVVLAGTRSAVAIHAGWRSLVGGVLEAASAALVDAGDQPRAAVIGPSLGACCFEFGAEGVHQFPTDLVDFTRGDRPFVNARIDADRRLRAIGCTVVDHVDVCTQCSIDCFSYRRQGALCGSQSVIAWCAP